MKGAVRATAAHLGVRAVLVDDVIVLEAVGSQRLAHLLLVDLRHAAKEEVPALYSHCGTRRASSWCELRNNLADCYVNV